MSLDEFREAEEQPGYRYELARGVLEATEIPGDAHGQVVRNLQDALSRYNARHPARSSASVGGSDIRLCDRRERLRPHPDLGVVFRGRPRDERGRRRPASSSRSSRRAARIATTGEKRQDYLVYRHPRNTGSSTRCSGRYRPGPPGRAGSSGRFAESEVIERGSSSSTAGSTVTVRPIAGTGLPPMRRGHRRARPLPGSATTGGELGRRRAADSSHRHDPADR